mmetsp:Transcript_29074/g.53029  ORF Transcript_29074/g.53029 Transcript_29074/m.53029 type:complete len:84 (+) Transcript_29074:1180-1431(+)
MGLLEWTINISQDACHYTEEDFLLRHPSFLSLRLPPSFYEFREIPDSSTRTKGLVRPVLEGRQDVRCSNAKFFEAKHAITVLV